MTDGAATFEDHSHGGPGRPTSEAALARAVERLAHGARAFARAPVARKIAWLEGILRRTRDLAERQVRAACSAKQMRFDSPQAGEEWLAGPAVTARNLRLLIESLRDVERVGAPRVDPERVRERSDGGVVVDVIPRDAFDRALLSGFSVETWLMPGVDRRRVAEHQARFYRDPAPEGGVTVVLGAGNVASIPPMDTLYELFVRGRVVVLKMNPVNEYLGPFLEEAFEELIREGFVAVVYGGAEVGAYLTRHPLVTHVHITGSDRTHDLIVWGPPGPEREARKQRREPLLDKPITSELGNVSPVMVVPGPYSDAELAFVAGNVAGMVTNNASFNCNAAKLLVLPRGWPERDRFLGLVRDALALVPPRRAYYPGAHDRYRELTLGRQGLVTVGDAGEGELPWTLVPGLVADDPDEKNFVIEPFCAILSETEVGSVDPVEFLAEAVKFANDRVWGTLNVTLFVHPSLERDPATWPAISSAIESLRYGTVAINHWPAMVYALAAPPWGGHPSATLENVQSGLGWVHNTLMLESIEKNVLRGPLVAFPKPAWFPGHRSLHEVGRRFTAFEAAPSWWKVPGLALAALRA